ncbi:MAG: nitrate ABC transporter substrate-binding protein, partial [Methylococcales bacterium]
YYSDAIWYLTQMRRWGQIAEYKPDDWYVEIAKKVYRPDIYMQAARELIAEGKAKPEDFPPADEDGFREPQTEFIDNIVFDGKKPNEYLEKFPLGLKGKDTVQGGSVVKG